MRILKPVSRVGSRSMFNFDEDLEVDFCFGVIGADIGSVRTGVDVGSMGVRNLGSGLRDFSHRKDRRSCRWSLRAGFVSLLHSGQY